MKKPKQEKDIRIKKERLNIKEFLTSYIALLLLVGIQTGLIVSSRFLSLDDFWQINIIMIYWAIVALIFCIVTNIQIKKQYELPMKKLGDAARKVANGDFSIYIEPIHSADAYDYIDVMFLDFNVMVQELGSIETLKNDFVSNVSHEIKTPLAIIKNYSTSLKLENLSVDTKNEYIETISTTTDKLSDLVTNILKLNKLENQEIDANFEQFNVCQQLSECVLRFESMWDEKNIDLEIDIEDRVIINSDKNLLEIVWNNLLSNAIKYTKPGGKVTVLQTSNSHSITIKVTDTGCGMNKETVHHIFDKFYQADPSRSTEGNGLGMTLTMRIIEIIEGTLSVSSKLNEGSTFIVTIPLDNQ